MDADDLIFQEKSTLLPKRIDLPHYVISINTPKCESLIDIKKKQNTSSIIADKKNYEKNYKIFNAMLPMLLINNYKFIVLNDIATKLEKLAQPPDYLLTSDYYIKFTKQINPVTTGTEYVRFLRHFQSQLDISFLYQIMDNFPCNYILYDKSEAIVYKNSIEDDKPVLLFRFITSNDIEYINYYTSIEQCIQLFLLNKRFIKYC